VVEAPVGRSWARRVGISAAALGALAFLVAMAFSGRMRESQQYVKFEPAGLLRETPETIDRVELVAAARRLVFLRAGDRWKTPTAAQVPAALVPHLEMSLRFMHVAAPVRVMARKEYAGEPLREFGLEPPSYTVSLYRGADTVLSTRFGARNPQEILQYVRVDGHDELYLLPVFVGREWELVIEAGAPP
jgi:hypothetical protein